jgi:Zn-dependent M28 family amino/carboxypeptidase
MRISAVFLAALTVAVSVCAQQPAATPAAPSFNADRAWADLQHMVEIGPRPSGSPAIEKTRTYIEQQLAAAGLTAEEQPFDADTPVGRLHMVNVRATLPGSDRTGPRIVIGGHYDTKRFKEFPFVGASDGASSAAFLLELARALKGRTNPLPIELLFLDGEEATLRDWDVKTTDHTYGSRYYVQEATRRGDVRNIRAFILIDMVADRDLDISREQDSTPWLTDAIWNAARRLNHPEFLEQATPIEDDHDEFLAAGIPSVDVIDLDYPQWHQPTDDLQHVSPRSLQIVGDVVLAALPTIEERVK